MNTEIKIVDTCGCPNWAKAFVRDVVRRSNINAEEIIIWDMTYKHIEMRAEVWDDTIAPENENDTPGGWIEKRFSIRYYEDDQNPFRLLLSYRFYDCERVIVEKVRPDGSVCQYDTPTYLDEGTYSIFNYWCCPLCVRIAD